MDKLCLTCEIETQGLVSSRENKLKLPQGVTDVRAGAH